MFFGRKKKPSPRDGGKEAAGAAPEETLAAQGNEQTDNLKPSANPSDPVNATMSGPRSSSALNQGGKKPARKTTAAEKPIEELTPAELRRKVREEAFSFESSRIEMIEKSEKRAWACAKGLGLTTCVLGIAIACMMPLKTTVPYVFEVDKNTGQTELIEVADPKKIPHSQLMDKFWLASYLRSRESYDYSVVDMEFNKVRELSMPNVFEPYKRQFMGDKSLDRILGPAKSIRIELLSVMPEGNGIAQVRFIRRMINNDTMRPESESYWTAKIGYEYIPNYTKDGSRLLVNPFGFKVTSYQLDQDFTQAGLRITTQRPVETAVEEEEEKPTQSFGISAEPDEKELAEMAASKARAEAAKRAAQEAAARGASQTPTANVFPAAGAPNPGTAASEALPIETIPAGVEASAPTVPVSGQSPDGSTAPVMGVAPGDAGAAALPPETPPQTLPDENRGAGTGSHNNVRR